MCLFYLLDDCDLSQVSSRATLYQRDVCCQAHPVHMVTRRYRDRKCFIFLIIWMGWHLGVTKKCLLVEVMWEYLCYPEHSSPAQTFWRTPRCSQDCWEGGETISSKSKGPWSVCVGLIKLFDLWNSLHDAVMVGNDICRRTKLQGALLGHLQNNRKRVTSWGRNIQSAHRKWFALQRGVTHNTALAHTRLTTTLQPPVTEVKSLMFTYLCFRLANMLLLKEELTVQVADINCVQINLPESKGL